MTQVVQRNNHVLQMLKRLKETLDNDKKKYADKVNVLVMTWERIAASAREQRPLAAICIVEKMYKDTLSIMLQGEWPKMSPVSKTHLVQMLNRCRSDLCKEMPWLNGRFRKLLELVNDPWTLPSLERILHKDPSPATPEQVVEFCESERGLLIVTRLTMLCSSRCEKVAIKLAEACFGALSAGNAALLSLFTSNEYNFIFDIYLCLLYKYKKLECIINALKTVSVSDGYYMVVRLKKRSDFHEQKIWKFSHQVAAVAARYFVTVSMLARTIPNSILLKNLIREWLSTCNSGENNVENEIRKVMQPAETSEHIYLMAEVLTILSKHLGNQTYSSLIMELYIRALTADINYLERVKLQNDKEQMTAYEKHLASKFLALADLVKDHSGVRREFVLTAFSIHPSAEIYRRVEEEAVASGKASPHSTSTTQESIEVGVLSEGLSSLSSEEPEGKETATDYSVNNDSQDSGAFVEISNRCPLHLPYDGIGPEGELCFQCGDFTGVQTPRSPTNQQQKKKERSLDALILIKGNTVTESLNYDVLSAPSQVLEAEKLGLSPQVCADLVTLLGSNRYHLLTWVLEWGELSSRCLRYMNEADTIKSGKKELKFLEIDYNQYKDWPENEDDEADCIEKGYEQWLEDDNTETDFDTDSKRSNTDDSEELMIKTAIRRSQKQMGRYAESSSDSEDSRSRQRNRKRGRSKKQLKCYSDSGSVSDSLGSDGQKQKRSSKKPRTKSKDLRKRLGRLKVLEMASDANNFSQSNDSVSSDILSNKIFSLPTSAAARSDPTVLKSLRAFRPNAHKTKNDDFVQSVTENIYNSNTIDDKMIPNINSMVFDCNDNKFISKGNRFSFGNTNMEIHFKTSGVRTKKYDDVIRTIKEDLISVSNIPNVANNATVNVVHIVDSRKSDESSQDVQSTASNTHSVSASAIMPSRNASLTPSAQKPKSENESQRSQVKKSSSSQALNQNAEAGYSNISAASSVALSRINPNVRSGTSGPNPQILSNTNMRPGNNKIIGQPQYMAFVNRSPLNQSNSVTNQSQSFESRNVGSSVLSCVTSRNAGQNLIMQTTRAPIQTSCVAAVPTIDPSKFVTENDRPNVLSGKNYSIQNVRLGNPTMCQQVTSGLNNGATQDQKVDAGVRPHVNLISSTPISQSITQNLSNLRMLLESTNQNITSSNKVAVHTSKSLDIQKSSNDATIINTVSGTNSGPLSTSKPNNVKYSSGSDVQFLNRNFTINNSTSSSNSGINSKPSSATTVSTNRISTQILKAGTVKMPQSIILQTNASASNRNSGSDLAGAKRNFQLSSSSIVKAPNGNSSEEINTSQNIDTKSISGAVQEDTTSRLELVSSGSVASSTTDVRNVSSTATSTVGDLGSRNYGSLGIVTTRQPYNEIVNIAHGMGVLDRSSSSSVFHVSDGNIPSKTSGNDAAVVAISDSSAVIKLDSADAIPSTNILSTVLKRNSIGRLSSATSNSQYSMPNTRHLMDLNSQGEAVQNIMISQSSNSSTIHYTVVNPTQQNVQQDNINSFVDDINRVKQEELKTQTVSPVGNNVKKTDFITETFSEGSVNREGGKCGSLQDLKAAHHQPQIVLETKKTKTSSSPTIVQTESNFIKKQVLNNQKITILVQNSDGDREKLENSQKSKLNDLLFRDDQKTCITFRAIKRTLQDGNQEEPQKKRNTEGNQNGNSNDLKKTPETTNSVNKIESNSSETLCQYLVLEAINDPSGSLPKFNQAFGKSYQIKLPQAIKPVESNDSGGGEGSFGAVEHVKSNQKISTEQRPVSLPVQNQIPVTESSRSTFEVAQKPVKSVYIDKEVKLNVHQLAKPNEGSLETTNISTIQMTEVRQPMANAYQNAPKSARSTVVQQLLRKVPATGPPTLQTVNSINTLTARHVKTQDMVSGSTLIYTTETRAQSQIVIQRAVGRVNNPTIGQVAPVIYTQNPTDQASSQTLLLAAVPAGTRGMVPGTQLVRLPTSSGVWKMTPSGNSPRIVQLRPQNLVLQSGQDQGLLMQSGQPVLLHHLTSLPVKPIGVVANEVKTDQIGKIDVKSDIFSKSEVNVDNVKMCSVSLEVDQSPIKSETSSPVTAASEHETVSLMKDIKEFENVFEETKLKFEMEEQQGVGLPEVENINRRKTSLTAVNVQSVTSNQSAHQTVLVQPQLMVHKPQMIITSSLPNQQTIFTQKIDKQLTIEKDSEKRLILTAKPKLGVDEGTQSQVAVAYVNHATSPSVNVQKPLVVVTNYAQPPTSPAPSITSQNSSSPNSVVSSVSYSGTGSSSSKTSNKSKSRNIKTVPNPSKSPPVAKPQQKSLEDANTAQKIYAILEEYAVQLRNSPDMNNRPAPRRRSNPPTNANAKRKKIVCKSKDSFSDGDETNFVEDIIEPLASSEDSSSGVTVLQVCVSSSH